MADGRTDNGSEPKLTGGQRADLSAALKKRPPDGGEALGGELRGRLRRLRAANPKKAVEVWAQDEATRLGLKPIARRVWSLKGRRHRSGGRTRYRWLYLYGFVRPETGDTFGVLSPRAEAERMSEAPSALAARAAPEGRRCWRC